MWGENISELDTEMVEISITSEAGGGAGGTGETQETVKSFQFFRFKF